jgi:hypothetical protein
MIFKTIFPHYRSSILFPIVVNFYGYNKSLNSIPLPAFSWPVDSGTNDDHKCRRCISARNPETEMIPRKLYFSCLFLSCASVYCPQPFVLEPPIRYTIQKKYTFIQNVVIRVRRYRRKIYEQVKVCAARTSSPDYYVSRYTLGCCDFTQISKTQLCNKQCCGSVCFWTSWIRIRWSEVRIRILLSPSKTVIKTLVPTDL